MNVPHDVQQLFVERKFWLAQIRPNMTLEEVEKAAWAGIKEDMSRERSKVIEMVTGKTWQEQVKQLVREAAAKVAEANLIVESNRK